MHHDSETDHFVLLLFFALLGSFYYYFIFHIKLLGWSTEPRSSPQSGWDVTCLLVSYPSMWLSLPKHILHILFFPLIFSVILEEFPKGFAFWFITQGLVYTRYNCLESKDNRIQKPNFNSSTIIFEICFIMMFFVFATLGAFSRRLPLLILCIEVIWDLDLNSKLILNAYTQFIMPKINLSACL